jgi:hypothetical protein
MVTNDKAVCALPVAARKFSYYCIFTTLLVQILDEKLFALIV